MEILDLVGFNLDSLELIIRILVASICGGLIGIERNLRFKEAGIRTHMIVALGSALMMAVSKYGFLDALRHQGSYDVSRIAANVITGVSFLGAGVIFVRGISIRGLTTAAGIWATSGIGIALGAGMYVVGVSATLIMIILQVILHHAAGGIDNFTMSEVSLTVDYSPGVTDNIITLLKEHGMTVQKFNAVKGSDNTVTLNMTVRSGGDVPFDRIVGIFVENEDIISFSL